MRFDVAKNTPIGVVALNMATLANNFSCQLTATFNGIPLEAKPASNPNLEAILIVNTYWQGLMAQRGMTPLPTDGISQVGSMYRREQEKILVEALSELDTLNFSSWNAVVNWLEKIVDIDINPFTAGQITATFNNKGGFSPRLSFESDTRYPANFTKDLIEYA